MIEPTAPLPGYLSNYVRRAAASAGVLGRQLSRLLEIKKKYDPNGLFIVHNGVGSEQGSRDGFTKL
jgi:berberine-like enzyme